MWPWTADNGSDVFNILQWFRLVLGMESSDERSAVNRTLWYFEWEAKADRHLMIA